MKLPIADTFEEEKKLVLLKRNVELYGMFLLKWKFKDNENWLKCVEFNKASPKKRKYLLEKEIINSKDIGAYEISWSQKWINEFGKEFET